MARQVVITAMGMVTSLGSTVEETAANIAAARASFVYSETDGKTVVAPVNNFDLRERTGRLKNLRYLNRGASMAVAAAVQAVQRADLAAHRWARAGLFLGAGPNLDLGGECPHIQNGAMEAKDLPALWILRFLPNTAASIIAQLTGMRGENLTIGNACAASLQALGEAFRRIRDGYLDMALAGGGDSRLSPGALLAYRTARALYEGTLAPHAASRPFDQKRSGFVPGEGGAFFVMEAAEHAKARGAPVLAEICGYGASLDGDAMTAPRPDGRWAEAAIRKALDQARLNPEQIGVISAHGTSTLLNDEMEAQAIHRIFAPCRPAVMALKSWTGHLAAACGAVELALCLCALHTGVWPHVRNLDRPCHPELNFLRSGRRPVSHNMLLQNFGFGGQNAALVVRPWQS